MDSVEKRPLANGTVVAARIMEDLARMVRQFL